MLRWFHHFLWREIKLHEKQNSSNDHHEEVTLKLHKEELQVSKKRVETADVRVYKKTFTEVKQIMVPVTHEQLIIEKKIVNPNSDIDSQIETICIPLSEEHIEVTLNPTVLEDVEVFKKQCEELIQVNETLKEEKVQINTFGDINVIVDDQ
ncbi:YsnF/AvaK domain-containing protein [Bacillus salipaludis]|uniref:YsnF/AvaK domain-containing protein n=1 Tax=Bacillus salipaludis TaxID=2547811 RepID=A0A4R5VJZ0_9BACI|nr:YsnF/AvaK domain-containing protein [Bacillus salipaludis]